MRYHVRALRANNSIAQFVIDAIDLDDARAQVEAQQCKPIDVKALRRAPLNGLFKRRKLSLVLFSQELLALVKAGLNLVEALDALAEREQSHAQRAVIVRLSATVREGKRFSTALGQQGDLFPPLYVGLIRSAEDTNDLPEALARYIEYQRQVDGVKTKVVNAAIYPTILLIVGSVVTLFLITFVVPRFASVYRESGRALPWMSELLLEWGRQVSTQPLAVAIKVAVACAAIVVALRYLSRTGKLRSLIALIPWIQRNLQIYELSRLYLTLSMLLKGGIPVSPALAILRPILSSTTADALVAAEQRIRSGTSVSAAFDAVGLTTVISQRMLRVGERSGQLAEMLEQAAHFYDGDIERFLDRFTRAFEPMLMAAIGAVVGFIVVLLYMPIFDLASGLQ